MNAQVSKNQYEMPKLLEQLDLAVQIINIETSGKTCLSSPDLYYAFSQILFSELVNGHCNFRILCGKSTDNYRFKTVFYGLTASPKKFQIALDNTLQNSKRVICFQVDILTVLKVSQQNCQSKL